MKEKKIPVELVKGTKQRVTFKHDGKSWKTYLTIRYNIRSLRLFAMNVHRS